MAPDLPDDLLGLSIEEPRERRSSDRGDEEEETYERFLFAYVGRHRLAVPVDDVKAITERSGELTRVPRASAAIAGVTDLRGEITAVIDPHVHFPDSGGPTDEPALLVCDRPTDEQPAAISVDEVIGVETVVEEDVRDASSFDPDDIDGTPLAHPLIEGVVVQEKRSRVSVREAIAAEAAADAAGADASERDRSDSALFSSVGEGSSMDSDGVEVREFSLDEEEPDEAETAEPEEVEVEIETTPVLDVEGLLLASGHLGEGSFDRQ